MTVGVRIKISIMTGMNVAVRRQNICEAQSQQQDFLLVGTDVALVVPNSTVFPAGALIYRTFQIQVLV